MDELAQLLATVSPEELEQLMGMGTLDERGGLLEQQLAQAQALRQQPMQQHSTPGGALASGLAGVLNTVNSAGQEKALRAQQEALLGKKDAGRNLYLELLRRQQMAPAPGSAGAGDVLPSSLFGLG